MTTKQPETPEAKGWTWCSTWKCWQKANYWKKIFPSDDGTFSTSEDGVWIQGCFPDFATAERSFDMTPEEAADYSPAAGGTYWENRPKPWEAVKA